MIKATLITLIGASLIGTGAHTIKPQAAALTLGQMQLSISHQGPQIHLQTKAEFSLTLKIKSGAQFRIRL